MRLLWWAKTIQKQCRYEAPRVNLIKLKNEFDMFKIYITKRKINHEHKITSEINNADIKIKCIKQELKLRGSILSVK